MSEKRRVDFSVSSAFYLLIEISDNLRITYLPGKTFTYFNISMGKYLMVTKFFITYNKLRLEIN